MRRRRTHQLRSIFHLRLLEAVSAADRQVALLVCSAREGEDTVSYSDLRAGNRRGLKRTDSTF